MSYIRAIALSCTLLSSSTLFAAEDILLFPAEDSIKAVSGGGLQLIYNKTNKTVVVELGDWFPTPYKLAPGQSTMAYVSTDRQAITIRSAQ
jgi:hypothetical protein